VQNIKVAMESLIRCHHFFSFVNYLFLQIKSVYTITMAIDKSRSLDDALFCCKARRKLKSRKK